MSKATPMLCNMSTWYEIKAAAKGTSAELLIYGDIGDSWANESVTAKQLTGDLAQLQADAITVRLNSYGGSVSDGIAIYNALRRHRATVTVEIDGVAVSIASLIALAGDTVCMANNALVMIHAPWCSTVGNAKDMRDMANVLDRYADAMLAAYATRLDENTARAMLTDGADHWFTADEALAAGLVDEVTPGVAVAAQLPKRFTPPNGGREKMTIETKPAKPDEKARLEVVANTEAEVMARIKTRNDNLAMAFSLHADKPGMRDLQARILADPSISEDRAREMILNKLGEDVEPIQQNWATPRTPIGYGRDHAIAPGNNSHHGEFAAAATDALLMRAGIEVTKPHPAAKDVRGMSAVQIAQTMVGHRGMTFSDGSALSVVKAAMSTSDFPLLLANVANKALMLGYENEPASHRVWTREVEAQDFKPMNRVALSEAPSLEKVNEAGEYRDGALSERAEAYSLETYGRILSLTRKAIINDDLGGFTRIPMAFGASAARKEADLVYALLTDNPAMSDGVELFHADHGNLPAGAALSVTSLGAARAAMRKQKAIGGEGFLNVVPRYLIVPAALETTAEQLVASLVDPAKQNATTNPNWIRSLDIVVEPRLDAVSETAWYLAASSQQVDTVEIAHLAGQRGVFTEEDTDFRTDNYRIKARLDFATQVIDWVGLQYNAGA